MASPTTMADVETRSMAKRWTPKGKLSAKERQEMPKSDFALPGKGEGPKGAGSGSYPIEDKNHARSALSRVARNGTSAEKAEVRAKVHRKFPGIGKSIHDHPSSRKQD